MRKIVAGFAASLDGYIEGPNGEIDWIIIDEKIDFSEEMKRFDAFFYGRKSYEMALKMGSVPAKGVTNYVFSQTLSGANKNFELITGDSKSKVETLCRQEGKDIAVFGGAGLLTSLLNLKLVNELSISFIPVLLGGGKPMVNLLAENVWLTFTSSRRYANGTVVLKYAVAYQQD